MKKSLSAILCVVIFGFSNDLEKVDSSQIKSQNKKSTEKISIEFSAGIGLPNALNLNASMILNEIFGVDGYVGSSFLIFSNGIFVTGTMPIENSILRIGVGKTSFGGGFHGVSINDGYGIFFRYARKTSNNSKWNYYFEVAHEIGREVENGFSGRPSNNESSFSRIATGFTYHIPVFVK